MRIAEVKSLKPGDVVGKTMYDEEGKILLHRGVKLTERYIRAIAEKGFSYVHIDDPSITIEVEEEADLRTETRSTALKYINESYQEIEQGVGTLKADAVSDIQATFDNSQVRQLMSSGGPMGRIHEVVKLVSNEVMSRPTLAGIASLKSRDGRLYEHSLDVCVVSIILGKALDQTGERIRQLATGALLHDIGMLFVEKEIPDKQRIRQHTLLGFELLKSSHERDILAPHVAYEHHEHQDGTGLPRGLKGSNHLWRDRSQKPPIPTLIGEIGAVANTYDRLLSGGHGYAALPTEQALERLQEMAGKQLNAEIVDTLIGLVPRFPKGTEIRVTQGQYRRYVGLVIASNPVDLDRPTIALVRDSAGQKIDPIQLDLAEDPSITIRAVSS
jgi:putative nucleotidyltransferase with HDIG domain